MLVDTSGQHSYWGVASITGSRNEGGEEEVLRRDVGPYDLMLEDLGITLTHRGRQNCGIFRVLDANGQTIVQLRSDFLQDCLWAEDRLGFATLSDVNCEAQWWETKLAFTQQELRIYTRPAGKGDSAQPWCTISLSDRGESETGDNEKMKKASTASANLVPVVSALVVALGEQGGLYIDRIEIRTLEPQGARNHNSGDSGGS